MLGLFSAATTFAQIPQNDLRAHYAFESDGLTLVDSGPNNLNGVNLGAVLSTDGILGNCLQYDGVNDSADLFNHNPAHTTLNIWYKALDATGPKRILHKGGAGGSPSQIVTYSLLHLEDRFRFNFSDPNGSNAALIFSDSTFDVSAWNMLTCSFDTTTLLTKFYVNGILQDSVVALNQMLPTQQLAKLSFYPSPSADKQPINGFLDEFIIWDRALTNEEVQTVYEYYTTTVNVPTLEANALEPLLYPNPAKELLRVNLNGAVTGQVTIALFDMHGKQSLLSNANQQNVQLNLEGLESGVYSVQIREEATGKVVVKRIVIQ